MEMQGNARTPTPRQALARHALVRSLAPLLGAHTNGGYDWIE